MAAQTPAGVLVKAKDQREGQKKEAGPTGSWLELAIKPTTEATLLGESWPGKLRFANTRLFLARWLPLHVISIFLNNLFVASPAQTDHLHENPAHLKIV